MEGFLNPKEVIKKLNLKEEMVIADFGSGSGGWVIPLAKKLEEGIIYAIDILEEPLSSLRAKIKLEKIEDVRIETIKADVEAKNSSTLSDSSCDLVLMTNLLFQTDDNKAALEEGRRVLKVGGEILVVDWKKDAVVGPKEGGISADEVKKLAEEVDLKLKEEFSAGTYHYGLIFAKE